MSELSRVLIVDDEPGVRLVFRTALETAGYAVAEAPDGAAALDAGPVDLIVLDLRMPGVDGMEVLRRLRARGDDTPVVVVTAHGDVPNAVEAMKLGAVDFLSKPLRPDVLRDAARAVLDRHERPSERAEKPLTAASQFATDLDRAKRAINRRDFAEADIFLKQALGLNGESAEAQNLMGVLHELRNEHDASYRSYRAALKADPHYEPARHNMTRYYERFTFGRSAEPVDLGGP